MSNITTTPFSPFDVQCSIIRTGLKTWAAEILRLKGSDKTLPADADEAEMLANLTLAYRHLEDATMRLGKAIQAYDGGRSVYDPKDAERSGGGVGRGLARAKE